MDLTGQLACGAAVCQVGDRESRWHAGGQRGATRPAAGEGEDSTEDEHGSLMENAMEFRHCCGQAGGTSELQN